MALLLLDGTSDCTAPLADGPPGFMQSQRELPSPRSRQRFGETATGKPVRAGVLSRSHWRLLVSPCPSFLRTVQTGAVHVLPELHAEWWPRRPGHAKNRGEPPRKKIQVVDFHKFIFCYFFAQPIPVVLRRISTVMHYFTNVTSCGQSTAQNVTMDRSRVTAALDAG